MSEKTDKDHAKIVKDFRHKLEKVTRFNRNLRNNELLTLHYLGVPFQVITRNPQLRLKVPLSTFNFEDQNGEHEGNGIALQLIFSCSINYPLQLPQVELAEKRNMSIDLELKVRTEISRTLDKHVGLYMIVPVVSRVQMLLNKELRRLPVLH